MSRMLLPLTVGLVWAAILMESLGAPYRLVQAGIALGVVVLVLQVPDTIDQWRAVRDHYAKRRRADDSEGPQAGSRRCARQSEIARHIE
jgi:hypothetical protein